MVGISPSTVGLFYQLAQVGELASVERIVELGAQDLHCWNYAPLLNKVTAALGREQFDGADLKQLAEGGPARKFFERLGWEYECIDTNGEHGALVLDLNFDPAPVNHHGHYDMVTNFGTSEHLINQINAFRVIHDLAKPGALLCHAVPFVGCVDHGFFTYQPNFFYALSRYNSYEVVGLWLNPNTALSSLIPWQHGLLNYVNISPTTDATLTVVLRKRFDAEFQTPFQQIYEPTQTPENAARYQFIVDGDALSGQRIAYLTRGDLPTEPK